MMVVVGTLFSTYKGRRLFWPSPVEIVDDETNTSLETSANLFFSLNSLNSHILKWVWGYTEPSTEYENVWKCEKKSMKMTKL